jgi:hypothetical protein
MRFLRSLIRLRDNIKREDIEQLEVNNKMEGIKKPNENWHEYFGIVAPWKLTWQACYYTLTGRRETVRPKIRW